MPAELPVKSTVDIKMPGLVALQKVTSSTAQRTELLNRWAKDYFISIHARHNTLSTGGGTDSGQRWKPLADATIKYRKRRVKYGGPKPKGGILADTLQLLGATLSGGGPGQVKVIDAESFSAEVGIGGNATYEPPTERRTSRTIGNIAAIHAAGKEIPVRRIVVEPNKRTLEKMETAATVWILKRFKEAQSKIK